MNEDNDKHIIWNQVKFSTFSQLFFKVKIFVLIVSLKIYSI